MEYDDERTACSPWRTYWVSVTLSGRPCAAGESQGLKKEREIMAFVKESFL
jgi:hypothetical protein